MLNKVKPGDPITAEMYNELAEKLERAVNLRVSGDLTVSSGPKGHNLRLNLPASIKARLTGELHPGIYSWQEVYDYPSKGFPTLVGGRVGTKANPAFEVNRKQGLTGAVVRLIPAANWGYNFEVARGGKKAGCGTLCVQTQGCLGILPSAPVVVKDSGGNTVGTVVTNGLVTGVFIEFTGSGSADGTYPITFTGGSPTVPASGTVTIAGGQGVSTKLLSGGSGYQGAPTATVTIPGGGTPPVLIAEVAAQGCLSIMKDDTYTLEASLSGYSSATETVEAKCGGTTTAPALVLQQGTICISCSTCDGLSPASAVVGASVTVGSMTGTTDTSGQACFSLPPGAYPTTVTFPSGFSYSGTVGVGNCVSSSLLVTSCTGVWVAAATDGGGNPGCIGSVTIYGGADGTGGTLGTGTIVMALDGSGGETHITIQETLVAPGMNFFQITIGWKNFPPPSPPFSSAAAQVRCTSATDAYLAIYSSEFPLC